MNKAAHIELSGGVALSEWEAKIVSTTRGSLTPDARDSADNNLPGGMQAD
jgi:hypothetical protein